MRPRGRFVFWAVWAVFSTGFLVCRWGLFDPVFYNVDEAEYAVGAQALSQGLLPGLDLIGSTKPPAIVFLYWSVFAVLGESLLVIQVTGIVLWFIALALTMRLGQRLLPDVPVWASALSFFLLANSFGPPRDLHALNVELPGVVFTLASLLLLTRVRLNRTLMVAGTLLGIAVMFRQSLVFFAIPAMILLLPLRTREVVPFAAGVVLPWLVLLIPYMQRDGLGWAYESWVRFPMMYAGDTGIAGFLLAAWYTTIEIIRQAVVPFLLAFAGIYLAFKARNRVILAMLIASALAVSSGSRFFEHYYIQALPVLALLAALSAIELVKRGGWIERGVKASLAVGAIMAILHFPLWRIWDPSAPPKGVSAESLDLGGLEIELAEFAAQQSFPNERIFVWGYCPQIYFHSKRTPAVRDFLCEYVTGYSPFSTSPRPYARPDAMEMMIEDLKKNQPKLIFDLSFVEYYPYSFTRYPLSNYPHLADYIRTNYHPAAQAGPVPIYALASN